MKIAYFIGDLSIAGGAERVMTLKANWLAERDHEVHIISFLDCKSPFYELVPSVIIHSLGGEPLSSNPIKAYFRQTIPTQNKLKKLLFSWHFDVFIMVFPYLESFVAQLNDGSKKVFEAHCAVEFSYTLIEWYTPNPILRWLKKRMQMRKNRVVNSKFDKLITLTYRDLKSRGNPINGIVIANPNTFTCNDKSQLDQKRVIAVGRYSMQKSFQYLLKAWAIIEARYPQWRLDFFGADNGEKSNLITLRDELGLKNAYINPATSEIKDEYLYSSIFAMSSVNEGFPMVLNEAMTCGVPCVAFDCLTGPSEIIIDQYNGIIVPTVGDVEGLAEAICQIIANEELRRTMGQNAKLSVGRFTMDKIMSKWVEVLEEVVKNNSNQ